MPIWMAAVLFASSATIRDNAVPIRSSCSNDADAVATLEPGSEIDIRFALAGDGLMCFKVAATVAGKVIEGYVPQNSVVGSDEFDRARRGAASLDRTVETAVQSLTAKAAAAVDPGASDAGRKALQLLESQQPAEALRAAEIALGQQPRNAAVLAIAALAAFRSDDQRRALDYLDRALEIQPDQPILDQLRKQLRREASADRGGERLYGARFTLRYDGGNLPPEASRSLLAVLDQEYARISAQLGCRVEERIPAIVQTSEAFRKATDAHEWTVGRYDGRIRIALVEGNQVGPTTRRIAAHEIVHACLASLGQWPAWFQEGMAQKFSGEALPPAARKAIRDAARAGQLPKLQSMAQDWSGMNAQGAALAYQYSLAAAEVFLESYQAYGIQNVLRNPQSIGAIAATVDRRMAE